MLGLKTYKIKTAPSATTTSFYINGENWLCEIPISPPKTTTALPIHLGRVAPFDMNMEQRFETSIDGRRSADAQDFSY